MDSFLIRRNDRLPALSATLTNSAGAAYNLTAATVRLNMREVGGSTNKINTASVTIVSATAGTISYSWGATDTNSTGIYYAEFEDTSSGALERTFPNPDFVLIHVTPSLD